MMKPVLGWQKRIGKWEPVPKYWGIGRVDVDTNEIALYPMPFNLIVRGWVVFTRWLQFGFYPNRWERQLEQAYHHGRAYQTLAQSSLIHGQGKTQHEQAEKEWEQSDVDVSAIIEEIKRQAEEGQ